MTDVRHEYQRSRASLSGVAGTFLHIGLHKTGTKFLQHKVFSKLSSGNLVYNPQVLDQRLLDYIRADAIDRPAALARLQSAHRELLEGNPCTKILLSREAMSGNLFSAYRDWDEHTEAINAAFPDSEVLVVLRFQSDWLESCYRESVHEHHYQSIKQFLSFDESRGVFTAPANDVNDHGMAHLDALRLDYSQMLRRLFELFGRERVHVFFFEELKMDPNRFVSSILSAMGVEEQVASTRSSNQPNRGYSALSIELSLLRAALLQDHGLEYQVHRPIFFFGPNAIPMGREDLSLLDKSKYWGPDLLRDNEEVRSPNYPNLSGNELVSLKSSWRYLCKNQLDGNYYADWDILEDLRPLLDRHYRAVNTNLQEALPLASVPTNYLSET